MCKGKCRLGESPAPGLALEGEAGKFGGAGLCPYWWPPVPFLQHSGVMPVAKGRVFRFTYFKQIRSNKTPVISTAFGRTGWCLPGLEGLFVTATYFLGKYPTWLFATFESWRKWIWFTELAHCIVLRSCGWLGSPLADYLLGFMYQKTNSPSLKHNLSIYYLKRKSSVGHL